MAARALDAGLGLVRLINLTYASRCDRALIQLKGRWLVGESFADANVTQPFPERIDLGEYRVVRLFDIDQVSDRNPTGSPGHPENFRTVALRIKVVTAKRADMIDDRVDPQASIDQPSINSAEVVEGRHSK